jgi:hypothetical protein
VTRDGVLLRVGRSGRLAILAGLFGGIVVATSSALWARQAAAGKTVWDGVFTAAQAERGRLAFQQHCAECHGGNLNGAEAVPLAGERFNLSWRESTVDRLFRQMSTSMPMSEDGSLAGTLARGTYVDIVALLLQANGFPAGSEELTPESAVGVSIVAKSGPGELPNSASAQVVGCLTRVAQPRGWKVTSGSRPVRSGPAYTPLTATAALGDREFPLLFVLTSLDKHRPSTCRLSFRG